MPLNLILIPLFAALDRFWGAGFAPGGFIDRNHHKLSALFTAALAVLLGYLAGSPWAALYAVAWFAVRCLPFQLAGGSLDPNTFIQIAGSFARFIVVAPFWLLTALVVEKHAPLALQVAGLVALLETIASAAYGLAVKQARAEGRGLPWDFNVVVELVHGAAYGAGVACLIR